MARTSPHMTRRPRTRRAKLKVCAAPTSADLYVTGFCTSEPPPLADAVLLLLLDALAPPELEPPQKEHCLHLQNLQWLPALAALQKAPHVS